MWLLSKFQNRSPNDEYTITALKDVYINYIYEDIYRKMYSIAKENLENEPTKILEIGAGSLSKAQKYFSSIQLSDGSSVSKFGKENQLIAEDLPFENAVFDAIGVKSQIPKSNAGVIDGEEKLEFSSSENAENVILGFFG